MPRLKQNGRQVTAATYNQQKLFGLGEGRMQGRQTANFVGGKH